MSVACGVALRNPVVSSVMVLPVGHWAIQFADLWKLSQCPTDFLLKMIGVNEPDSGIYLEGGLLFPLGCGILFGDPFLGFLTAIRQGYNLQILNAFLV